MCKLEKLHVLKLSDLCVWWEHPFMTSPLEGEGGTGKADKVREVAWKCIRGVSKNLVYVINGWPNFNDMGWKLQSWKIEHVASLGHFAIWPCGSSNAAWSDSRRPFILPGCLYRPSSLRSFRLCERDLPEFYGNTPLESPDSASGSEWILLRTGIYCRCALKGT